MLLDTVTQLVAQHQFDSDRCRFWEEDRDRAYKENARLRAENAKLESQLKVIEEDGTEEHNAAVRLRQELVRTREENARLKDVCASLKLRTRAMGDRDRWHLRAEEAETLLEECEAYISWFVGPTGAYPGPSQGELLKKLRARKEGRG